ncbi:MAG TPA: anti-sigma factor RsbA family regulatory protein [Solirubrobacteraceae bacterium]|nr:anti-sigma factor RsbA family regulatory protein [Solirubrobacteraceae bacterium]
MTEGPSSGASPAEDSLIHVALLYRTPEGYGSQLEAFVRGARAAAEPVLAVLPSGGLATAQRACGEHADAVRWTAMEDVARNPSRLLSLYSDWITEHSGRVRIVGEPVWPGRGRSEAVECLRHEALVNHELAAAPVSLLCPYDAGQLDAEILTGAAMTHPWLIDDHGQRRESPDFADPLAVATGRHWPLEEPVPPISEHPFSGDLGSLRRAVAQDPHAAALGSRRSDLVLAVSEAASNALKHADGTCVMRLWSTGAEVISEVWTRSTIRDAFAGRRRPPWDAEDGRGLWLINQVCDLVELRSGGEETILRMHLSCPA